MHIFCPDLTLKIDRRPLDKKYRESAQRQRNSTNEEQRIDASLFHERNGLQLYVSLFEARSLTATSVLVFEKLESNKMMR